jgi:hypothetical protein
MNPTAYYYVSGAIFGVVGVLHIGRAALRIPVLAGEWEFPFWLSWPGGLVAILLCLWAFRLARRLS